MTMAMRLEPDSERMVLEHYQGSPGDYLIYLFHDLSYRFARDRAAGAKVLDLGCGSGYGTAMLAESANTVVGVDVSEAAIRHAQQTFSRKNVEFRQLPPDGALPFDDQTFDLVASFQVIEHVRDHGRFVSEIARVLRPGGLAIIATPDRSTRLFAFQKPWNRWHVREYSSASLLSILRSEFRSTTIEYMSGRKDIISIEIRRCRRLKWLTLPATLPFIPESTRFWALTKLRKMGRKGSNSEAIPKKRYPFSISDLWIGPNSSRSVNLIALARKDTEDI